LKLRTEEEIDIDVMLDSGFYSKDEYEKARDKRTEKYNTLNDQAEKLN
jgi:hypothetical protein